MLIKNALSGNRLLSNCTFGRVATARESDPSSAGMVRFLILQSGYASHGIISPTAV
jgi:hypothetical protein